ncbi:MAG: hypothetical protein ACTSQH_00555 [Candidatus Hodarchaeales archaeon]
MEAANTDLNAFLIYEVIANNGRLVCSHCGKRLTLNNLFDEKIVVEADDGYLSHVECFLSYVMKSEPIISSCLENGLYSEAQVRTDLLSRPFESVLLDISRKCSYRRLSVNSQAEKCSRFIATEANLIEMRNSNNLTILYDYMDITLPDLRESDIN